MPMTSYGESEFAKAAEAFRMANRYINIDFLKYLDQQIAGCVFTKEDMSVRVGPVTFPDTLVGGIEPDMLVRSIETVEELMELGLFDRETAERIMNPPPLRVYKTNGHIDEMLTNRVPPQYKAEATTYDQPAVQTLRVAHAWQKGEWICAKELSDAANDPENRIFGDKHKVRLRFDVRKGALGGWVAIEDSAPILSLKGNSPVDTKAQREDLAERAAYVGLSVGQYVEVMRAAQEKLNR